MTRDSGIAKDGSHKGTFEPGMRITAEVTVFAEGTRGSLAKQLLRDPELGLMEGRNPQTWGTGIKEIWEVTPMVGAELKGKVIHTGGYPLDLNSYGGSWIYGLPGNKLSIGFVVGLDHGDARLDPPCSSSGSSTRASRSCSRAASPSATARRPCPREASTPCRSCSARGSCSWGTRRAS